MQITVEHNTWGGHALIDSGDYQKLERFGEHTIIRPEPKAWWRPTLPKAVWQTAVAHYTAEEKWKRFSPSLPSEWNVAFKNLTFSLKFFNTSKHLGLFPEQSPHWEWIHQQVTASPEQSPSVLSLFGYTGAASLVAAAAGAHVTHVDASKPALEWAKHNQKLSGLESAPIRWILEDAMKFVQREARRNKRYHAIILDPPSFGRGPKGEVWKAEANLLPLLEACLQIMEERPLFILLTLYALDASCIMIHNLLQGAFGKLKGAITVGELALQQQSSPYLLPLSIFGRWAAGASAPAPGFFKGTLCASP